MTIGEARAGVYYAWDWESSSRGYWIHLIPYCIHPHADGTFTASAHQMMAGGIFDTFEEAEAGALDIDPVTERLRVENARLKAALQDISNPMDPKSGNDYRRLARNAIAMEDSKPSPEPILQDLNGGMSWHLGHPLICGYRPERGTWCVWDRHTGEVSAEFDPEPTYDGPGAVDLADVKVRDLSMPPGTNSKVTDYDGVS